MQILKLLKMISKPIILQKEDIRLWRIFFEILLLQIEFLENSVVASDIFLLQIF
jgi:hypothetical protein